MIEAEPLIRRCRWTELALRRHGFDGERLQKLASKIANDYLRYRGAALPPHRFNDLRDYLVERAMRAIMRYDPERLQVSYGSNGGDPVASWVADIMETGCTDWYRAKSEGNGDRRYGNDNRIELSDDPDPADHNLDFANLVDDRRRASWQMAADDAGISLEDLIVISVDGTAKQILGCVIERAA